MYTLTLNFSHRGFDRLFLSVGLLSGSVEAGRDESWFNPLILIFNWAEDTKTNSVLPVQAGPGWALEPGPRPWRHQPLAATGARHQGWQLYPDAGLSLVSGANTGLWLAGRVTPVSPWSQMRGDEMQPEIIKFLPVGGSVMHSTRPVLACNAPTWQYPLLHVFMASLNTMLQSTLSALMGAKCKMIQRINIVPCVIPCH